MKVFGVNPIHCYFIKVTPLQHHNGHLQLPQSDVADASSLKGYKDTTQLKASTANYSSKPLRGGLERNASLFLSLYDMGFGCLKMCLYGFMALATSLSRS